MRDYISLTKGDGRVIRISQKAIGSTTACRCSGEQSIWETT